MVLVKRLDGRAVWSSNLNVKEGWSNVTKTIPAVGQISWRFNASDLSGNWKETETGTFNVAEPLSPATLDATVSVQNINKDKLVTLTGSSPDSSVSTTVRDPKGKQVFQGVTSSVGGLFAFNFTFSPKTFGNYTAEITSGSSAKTLAFEVLKHKIVKAKIKQPKQTNYAVGEKIKFGIDAIDDDTGTLYPNATLNVFVTDPEGNTTEVNFTEDATLKGKYLVELNSGRGFTPGVHKLKVRLSYISPNPGEVVVEEEITFAVGMVNVNTHKSIYTPGETARITVGVLNEQGKRASDANITLGIGSPSGNLTLYNSYNGDFGADELDGSQFIFYT